MCANEDLNTQRANKETPFFGDVCLLGLGVTGRAVADFFLENPSLLNSLTLFPGEAQLENRGYLDSLPGSVAVFEGEESISGAYDVAVVSPGIPPHSDFYRNALSVAGEVISEPELAWRIAPENWVAVTGTNGKTTVTELITALLKSAGKGAWAAGNIGTPCIEVIGSRLPGDWLIAELSSYQLHSTVRFAPDVAVLLNITPDHLNWHGSHEGYAADKQRILANLAPGSAAIIDVTLPETRDIADKLVRLGRRVICVGSPGGLVVGREGQAPEAMGAPEDGQAQSAGRTSDAKQAPRAVWTLGANHTPETAFIDADTGVLSILLNKGSFALLHSDDLGIKGPHNLSNALAAAAAAAELGAAAVDISRGLADFAPLPHRFEPCGEVAGVTFINDSKATNIDAALKALAAFDDEAQAGSVIALFGGLDKGTDLSELVAACKIPCRCTVCYGEAGERFFAAMEDAHLRTVLAKDFDDAFARAFDLAQAGDTVLLSPACASFDEFDSFEARGEQFKRNVAGLREGGHGK